MAFLRDSSIMKHFQRKLREVGKQGAAAVLATLSLVSIAEWRWHTLGETTAALAPVLATISMSFERAWFQNSADQSRLQRVCSALQSADWMTQFHFVNEFMGRINRCMRWIGECPCHINTKEPCMRRGRRLHEARTFITSELMSWTDWVAEMTVSQCGHVRLWQEFTGVIRYGVHVGNNVFHHLHTLPWLLARLDQRRVKVLCLGRWTLVPADQHHELTRFFLDPEYPGSLRHLVEDIDDEGGNVAPELRVHIEKLKNIPLDDIVQEEPHARMKKQTMNVPNHSFPWAAATVRLGHNLDVCTRLPSVVGKDLQTEWDRWNSVVKFANTWRPGKMTRREAEDKVYFMHAAPELDGPAEDSNSDSSPSDGQSDGGSASDGESSGGFGLRPPDRYASGLVARPLKKSRTDEGGGDGGGGDGGGGAPAADDAPRPKRKPGDWAARVLREFLASALARGTYITVTVPSEIHVDEAGEPMDVVQPMQVLAVDKRQVNVTTYDVTMDPAREAETSSVQQYERWMSFDSEPCGVPTSMDIFTMGGPDSVNFLALSGTGEGARSKFLQWDVEPSDVEGCMSLVNPRGLQASHKLTDRDVPYLALIDALHHAGFQSTLGIVEHRKAEPGDLYDGRVKHKDYLRCVLMQKHLFDAGCEWFDSRASSAFYALLRLWPQKAVPGMTAKECQRLLGKAPAEDDVRSAVLDSCAAPPPPPPPPQRARPRGGLGAPFSGGLGGPPPPPPAGQSESALAGSGSSSSTSSSSSSDESGSSSGSGLAASGSDISTAPPPDDDYPRKLFGQTLKREEHAGRGTGRGLRVACLNPAHNDGRPCSRYRSVTLGTETYGVQAPTYFLGCWLLKSHDFASRKAHMNWQPNASDIEAYLSTYGPTRD